MPKRLVVIDGADEGRYFPLLETGSSTIGSNRRSADICLHDLYVSRTHCEIKVDGDQVEVTRLESRPAIFINGKEITQDKLQLGDVLRVGNSHLRLESDEQGVGSEVAADNGAAPATPEGHGGAAPGPARLRSSGRLTERPTVSIPASTRAPRGSTRAPVDRRWAPRSRGRVPAPRAHPSSAPARRPWSRT